MLTVKISFDVAIPENLARHVSRVFNCQCYWRKINNHYFSFTVVGCQDLDELADVLAEFEAY